MARFEKGSYVEVIATGRIGQVIHIERTEVTVIFFDKSSIEPEEDYFKKGELKEVELTKVKTSQLKSLVRGDITVRELTGGSNLLPPGVDVDSEEYDITPEDLLAGVKSYVGMSVEDAYSWLDALMFFCEEISFPNWSWEDIEDFVTDDDILAQAYDEIDALHFRFSYEEPAEIKAEDFEELRDILEIWIESGGRDYSESVKFKIAHQYDCDTIDIQSRDTQKMFKACLDYLCDEKRDPQAIQRRGYCYYCGTKVYPNDWIKATEAFLDYYHLTGDASAANTLGYIYYYGRCNGGVPEYDKAFKFFSIGHAFGYYESTYKLADMFVHGYGVAKDLETANHLYWSVYDHNHKSFIRGDFECKFADAALRIGNCYRDEIGEMESPKAAYYYYLQADYAIRERLKRVNYYGDTTVFNGVQKALAHVRQEYLEKGRTEKFEYPEWIAWTLLEYRRCKLTIKELKNNVLSLDVVPLKRRNEEDAPMMLITVPKADYCELRKKIRIKTAPDSEYRVKADRPEIVFDSVEYDWSEMKTIFYLHDDIVGEIITDYYTFTAPAKNREDAHAL